MNITKRIARPAGLFLAATCMGLTAMAAPAEAAAPKCVKNGVCFYEKPFFKGRGESAIDNPSSCMNMQFPVRSAKGESSRHDIMVWTGRNCTGLYYIVHKGFNNTTFPHVVRSFY
ncbi:peptidase inhibitor family I36 protein [Streptomyces angustmyceticus]|uniref:peptidase inhibitor family I36 protein n=1 Tax=Streptomyces angustmyceticus TaxID=285578 RepID=UPI00344B72B0